MATTLELYRSHRTWRAGERLLDVASKLLHNLLRRRRPRRGRRRLYEMSDYVLKDIGITRWEIDWVTNLDARALGRRRPLQ